MKAQLKIYFKIHGEIPKTNDKVHRFVSIINLGYYKEFGINY